MIISKTPLRISFVGGGSDIPSFYKIYGGGVISTTINKYIYIAINKRFERNLRVSYGQTEIAFSIHVIQHDFIRECLRMVGIKRGIEIVVTSDVPWEGVGLGSSGAFIVGLLHALYTYLGETPSAERLAQEACQIEIDICGRPIGKQDQYIAAYGGFKNIRFNPNGIVNVFPVLCPLPIETKLQNNLLRRSSQWHLVCRFDVALSIPYRQYHIAVSPSTSVLRVSLNSRVSCSYSISGNFTPGK